MANLFSLHTLHSLLTNRYIGYFFLGLGLIFIVDLQGYALNAASIVLFILAALLLLFTPYMLYVLYLYDKRPWIGGFFIWMGIGFLPRVLFPDQSLVTDYILTWLPAMFLLIYLWALKDKTREWITESEAFAG